MKKKSAGRPQLYKKETKVVSFKVPIDKIEEIKRHVKNKLSNYLK